MWANWKVSLRTIESILPPDNYVLKLCLPSGKSSLLLAILGMLELETGSITIDGRDISRVPRDELRKRLNTLPQEPFFLQGSVRDNIDPLRLSTDERIVETLCTVRLWDILDSRGGLDAPLGEDELSHGQRQLFCLARAIARPGNIVIVDEATGRYESTRVNSNRNFIPRRFSDWTAVLIRKQRSSCTGY